MEHLLLMQIEVKHQKDCNIISFFCAARKSLQYIYIYLKYRVAASINLIPVAHRSLLFIRVHKYGFQ